MSQKKTIQKVQIATWSELLDRTPAYALVANVDLVVIRYDHQVSVLFGRCQHRGALMSDGHISGEDLICGVHNWDYRLDTGISAYDTSEVLHKFTAWISLVDDAVYVDKTEIVAWQAANPQAYQRDHYLGLYEDHTGTADEPHNKYIRKLAKNGLEPYGHHGMGSSMGVPQHELPQWDDLQIITAQLARRPLFDDDPIGTELIIGPNAVRPLKLTMPIFVSDMSFGALSEEAKVALAMGAEMAGTGICSGEGGVLPEEKAANSRYFYELASGRFGFSWDKVADSQAFHFKGGQGAKTGTGGHLPGSKVIGRIAEVRGLEPGTNAVSPATFTDMVTVQDFQAVAAKVREISGGIPIGFKISAQHIELDLDFAFAVGVDYIILDGRGGGTGSAPNVFKNNISVPTIAALARARQHFNRRNMTGKVTLIATGGLRTESDFAKAMMLGADGVAIANSAMQAIGCLGMRACSTNNCPVGIATQKKGLRSRLVVRNSAENLYNFLTASTHLMQVLARACGHDHLGQFSADDLTTWKRDIAYLTGVRYAGVVPL